ncbi:MAG TPA: hypothetical protein VGL65_00695 [Gemmatimonadales bacterium]
MKRIAAAGIILLAAAVTRGSAQGFGVETLGSVETWKTDTGSRLLARNGGDPVATAEVYAWLAWQPAATLRLMAIGELDAASGAASSVDGNIEMFSLRWWHSRAVRVEAGKILLPLGEFAARRFANVNPLIGDPDTYVSEYPWGASVSGGVGPIDYVAAAVTLPAVNVRYTPQPGSELRPVIGAGVSLGPRLRIGVNATHGPYLGESVSDLLPIGTTWHDFSQTVATLDLRFSAGRTDTRGEMAWSSYDVPTVTDPVHGLGWYLESRIALSPRFFIAARYEDNRYAFVLPVSPAFWVGAATTQMNGEAGLGFRLSADALIKASLRRDHWPVHEISGTSFPDGYAVAVQFSYHADLLQLLTRKP